MTRVVAFALALGCACFASGADLAAEAPYLAENDAAMTKMMNDMTVKPTGDVDRDFVAMMVPHHQGAVDMARALLRYGRNEQLRRLAQEIIVTQQQEIAVMRLAVGDRQSGSDNETYRSHDPAAVQRHSRR
jgi:uncharacterized protein (DUF305 family)